MPVLGDGAVEANETLTLTLSAPTNATIADGSGVVTLLNDDAAINTWGDFYVPRDGAADAALLNVASATWIFRDSNTGNVTTVALFGSITSESLAVPAE